MRWSSQAQQAPVLVQAKRSSPLPDDADEASALQANLRRNVEDHEREAAAACQHFYCGPLETPELPRIKRYTVGPLPSHDFAALLPAGAEDVVVTEAPMFGAAECAQVAQRLQQLQKKSRFGVVAWLTKRYYRCWKSTCVKDFRKC